LGLSFGIGCGDDGSRQGEDSEWTPASDTGEPLYVSVSADSGGGGYVPTIVEKTTRGPGRPPCETAADGPMSGGETGGVAAATGSETADCPSTNDSDTSECRMSLRRDSQQYESASGLSADDATATGAAGDSHAKTPVAAWFERVEGRLATVERLGEVDTVPTATAALRAAGGLEGARETARAVEADRRRLLAVAQRAQALAARAEAVDVPVATLERLA